MISAVLDACVLYSAPLRGLLLNLATNELVKPFWSEDIQNEWMRSLLQNRPDLKREDVERTRRKIEFRLPHGLVLGYESIMPTLVLPDPDDRHVLAVAIRANAEYIVTFNLKDFPHSLLHSYNVEAVSPDEFVLRLIQKIPDRVLRVVKLHRLSLKRPPKTVAEYLATLDKQGLPKTVAFLQQHEGDI